MPINDLTLSPSGICALVQHEGIVPGPYRDSVGVWTYGVGHTAAAGEPDPARLPRGMPADLAAELRQVFRVLRADLPRYEREVRAALRVPVSQQRFDALVSFHFNTGAIGRASFVQVLNAGRSDEAARGMMAWSRPDEVIPRRMAEQRLFRDGVYPGGLATVWGVDRTGRVIWKPQQRLSDAQVLAMLQTA